MLCRVGVHDWTIRSTVRPGTYVSRCSRCGAVKVRHKVTDSALRRQKLFARGRWFLAAISLSVMIWYLAVVLGLTGHTKIIWGVRKVRDKLDTVRSHTHYGAGKAAGSPKSEGGG